ncbi:conserved hypothetical protein [Beggiatoa sp. PS]|nr:conserved hypothetical protein [Beggiatoa sp. PS]
MAVFGDSLADGIWAALYRELRADKRVTVLRETITSSGLTGYNWQHKVKGLLTKHPVHIAVIVIGTNDGRVLIQGRKRFAYKSKSWEKNYLQRVNDLMSLLETHKIPTYWVGLPAVRRSNMEEQVAMLNDYYEQSATLFPAVHFLSTWHLTVDKEGKYSAYGLDKTGRKKLLRANDGVHFTTRGYDLLADYVLKHIYEDLPFIKKNRNKNA